MLKKLLFLLPLLLVATSTLAACEGAGPTPTATPGEWAIPNDKYVFIERWIEIYEDSAMSMYIDFPTYIFDENSGELKPHIAPPGHWFPLEDLTELKIVYGRGTSRIGSAGTGANSKVFAVSELPFVEPAKEDTDVVVTLEGIDAQGVAYLRRGDQQIVLHPGQDWTRDGKSTVEWGGVKSEISSRERITNYGVLDKAKIQLMK